MQSSASGTGVWQVPKQLGAPSLALEVQATGFASSCFILDTNVGEQWTVEARLEPEVLLVGTVSSASRAEAYGTHVRVVPHPKLMRGAGYYVPEDAILGGPSHGGRSLYEALASQDVAVGSDGSFFVTGLGQGQEVWLASVQGLSHGTMLRMRVVESAPRPELDAPLRVQCAVTVTGDRRGGGYELRAGGRSVALDSVQDPTRVVFSDLPAEAGTLVELLLNGVPVAAQEVDLSAVRQHSYSISVPPR